MFKGYESRVRGHMFVSIHLLCFTTGSTGSWRSSTYTGDSQGQQAGIISSGVWSSSTSFSPINSRSTQSISITFSFTSVTGF